MTGILAFVLGNSSLFMIGGGVIAALIALKIYGRKQYKKGESAAEVKFEKADREGAKHARKTAEQSLRDSSGVDANELLNRTNGLRNGD